MNIRKLRQLVKDSGKTKVQIAKLSGITRVTLDNALQGGDIRVSIIESLAKTLGVRVGVFFDEDAIGQNAIAQGQSSVAAINSDVIIGQNVLLEEKVKHLEEIIAEKERLINILMERK
ncbi:helix-turn-helix domain-containing protein [Barnesiella propionica]|uniref:helix-turn-helix domain-containing protein n=1 Tax=Barnesiella propionica TaxID=2981781 RepID=UPI0021D1B47A|nr:helix-turn-helix transcriptional regulator [Barnesiella propionica]MCU6767391.1 helix-turn-helix domain-containing protein [Barnesiella propionica]